MDGKSLALTPMMFLSTIRIRPRRHWHSWEIQDILNCDLYMDSAIVKLAIRFICAYSKLKKDLEVEK